MCHPIALYGFTAEAYDGRIWMLGGWKIEDSEPANGVWFSTDGIEWTKIATESFFPPRVNHASVVFENCIWILGGGLDVPSDVWYYGQYRTGVSFDWRLFSVQDQIAENPRRDCCFAFK